MDFVILATVWVLVGYLSLLFVVLLTVTSQDGTTFKKEFFDLTRAQHLVALIGGVLGPIITLATLLLILTNCLENLIRSDWGNKPLFRRKDGLE